MEIIIPFRTPTYNHLYWHRGNRKFMKSEAKELRKKIIEICRSKNVIEHKGGRLMVVAEIYEDWYCKNGLVKKKDIANREKFLIDSVFEGLGLDDKFIFEHNFIKVQSDKEYSRIVIIEL